MLFQPVAFGLFRSDAPGAHLQEKPVVTTGAHLKQVLITLPKCWSSIDGIGLCTLHRCRPAHFYTFKKTRDKVIVIGVRFALIIFVGLRSLTVEVGVTKGILEMVIVYSLCGVA